MRNQALLNALTQLAEYIDSINEWIGKAVSWLVLVMVLLISYDVGMRYFFNRGSIALQELEWHIFSIIFLMGAAYTFKHDDHVRLDLFYKSRFMDDYRRAWVNALGGLLFLMPFCLLIIISSWPFVSQSFIHAETSPDPGGMPYRWILKASIPLSFSLLLLQGLGNSLANIVRIIEKHR